jgi:hypothetical protein
MGASDPPARRTCAGAYRSGFVTAQLYGFAGPGSSASSCEAKKVATTSTAFVVVLVALNALAAR